MLVVRQERAVLFSYFTLQIFHHPLVINFGFLAWSVHECPLCSHFMQQQWGSTSVRAGKLIETLPREAVKPMYLKLSFILSWSCGGFEAEFPFLKNIMLLILVFLKTCQFAPQEKWVVGMNNLISYPCVPCPSLWVTALLEKLLRKPSGFKILLIYCMPVICFLRFVFPWVDGISDVKFPSVAGYIA